MECVVECSVVCTVVRILVSLKNPVMLYEHVFALIPALMWGMWLLQIVHRSRPSALCVLWEGHDLCQLQVV